MFESIAPDAATARLVRSRFYKTLPASLLVHGIAIVAVLLGALWNVTFPQSAPAMMFVYNLVEVPPPPPPPPPPPAAAAKTAADQTRPADLPPSTQILAPTIIPDEIPIVTLPGLQTLFEGGAGSGVEGGIVGGVAGGVVGGSETGVIGGDIGGVEEGVVGSVDSGRVVIPRDAALSMHALSKTYPIYPEGARLRGWEDQLVVRYVIGTNGRVKEVTVLDPASHKVFDEAAVSAIRHWRFRPLIKDGQAMEVVHELTVYFRLAV